MRSIMRSRSSGSLVPPTDHGPAPWPRSTMDLYHAISTIDLMRSLCSAGHRSGSSTMAFILPGSKYTTVEQAPTPTDPRVTLRELPERVQVPVSRGQSQ